MLITIAIPTFNNVSTISKAINSCITQLEANQVELRERDQRVFVSDLTKAQEILAWKPQVTAKQGVTAMHAWIQTLT